MPPIPGNTMAEKFIYIKNSVAHKQLREALMLEPRGHRGMFGGGTNSSLIGDGQVKGLELLDVKTGQESTLEEDGVFVHIGLELNTKYLRREVGEMGWSIIPSDTNGYVLVNDKMAVEMPGVFCRWRYSS